MPSATLQLSIGLAERGRLNQMFPSRFQSHGEGV